MSEFFSYSGIKDFLKRAGEMYGVYSFRSWKGGNGIILRHDIDFDLNAANRMADLEKELGITATYFIMTSSERYNACSRSNRDLIRRLARNGFEIGLHFDPQIYDGSPSMAEEVEREARLLESISGSKVESISLHNPSVRMEFPLFDGYRNAYDPSIFSSDNYLSDSCMDFRGKYPEVFISKAGSGPLQLLLHLCIILRTMTNTLRSSLISLWMWLMGSRGTF